MSLSSLQTTCTLEGCDRPVHARGLCVRDYQRKRTFEASNHGVAWDPREAVKRGRPGKPYSPEAVRKVLAGGKPPKCLRMASGTPTLATKHKYTDLGKRKVAKGPYEHRSHSWGDWAPLPDRAKDHDHRARLKALPGYTPAADFIGLNRIALDKHYPSHLKSEWPGKTPASPAPRYVLKRTDLAMRRDCEPLPPSDLRSDKNTLTLDENRTARDMRELATLNPVRSMGHGPDSMDKPDLTTL